MDKMELRSLPVMLLVNVLGMVPHARGSPKAVVSIKPFNRVYTCERVILTCKMDAEESFEWMFIWYKNGDILPAQGDRFKVLRNGPVHEVSISCAFQSDSGVYTCRGQRKDSHSSEISDAATLTVSETPHAVLSVFPQRWMNEGNSVTLLCEVTDSSTDWTFNWYREVPNRDINGHVTYRAVLLSESRRGSGGNYTLSPAALHHTGVYVCKGKRRGGPTFYTYNSDLQPLWINGEAPPVSLIISSNTTQHFPGDSLSMSCEGQGNSTGWILRQYTHKWGVAICPQGKSDTGSTCNISSVSTSDTGVYWCESGSGVNSNPVNITVHGPSHGEASFSVLKVISKAVVISLYLLVTIILIKYYRAGDYTEERVIEE